MLATEWIEDPQWDAAEKIKALKLNLPDTEINEMRSPKGRALIY
jgi:hypothetical protein